MADARAGVVVGVLVALFVSGCARNDGPSVHLSGPTTLEEGDGLDLEFAAEGVDIVTADGRRNGTGHFHIFVDPEFVPWGGNAIPPSVEDSIIHTTEDRVTIQGLKKGEHTIWLVLGDGQHYAFDPLVMDQLEVRVLERT